MIIDFNKIVKIILLPVLTENAFVVVEEYKDYVEFKSFAKGIALGVGLFRRGGNEMSVSLSIGKDVYHTEDISKLYKESEYIYTFLRDEEMAKEAVEALKSILLENNCALLNGDKKSFDKLEFIKNKLSKDYNNKRDLNCLTEQANTAWSNQNYSKFIELIEQRKNEFPSSFAKKLEIAKLKQKHK